MYIYIYDFDCSKSAAQNRFSLATAGIQLTIKAPRLVRHSHRTHDNVILDPGNVENHTHEEN